MSCAMSRMAYTPLITGTTMQLRKVQREHAIACSREYMAIAVNFTHVSKLDNEQTCVPAADTGRYDGEMKNGNENSSMPSTHNVNPIEATRALLNFTK